MNDSAKLINSITRLEKLEKILASIYPAPLVNKLGAIPLQRDLKALTKISEFRWLLIGHLLVASN